MLKMMFPKTKSSGFTLIELVMSIVVLSILLAVGMPSLLSMLRNSEIRNAAGSIANGMQRARAEAVARNASVLFVLCTNSLCLCTDGSNSCLWNVVPGSSVTPVDSKSTKDGSSNVTVSSVSPTSATTVTFNNVGQVVTNADASASLTQVNLAATGGTQNLRVTIGAGGNAKACNPNLPTNSSPSAC